MDWTPEKQKQIYEIIDRMGLCECGTGENYNPVEECLQRARDKGCMYETSDSPDIAPAPKGMYFVSKVCDSWGLLEHGTGCGWPWMTEDGELLLAFLEEFNQEGKEFPDWAFECESAPVLSSPHGSSLKN
jgi:hypothetical protein